MTPLPPKKVRFLADEFHSESWSVSAERAREIAPEHPANSSYARAAVLLAERDIEIRRNTALPLTKAVLTDADVVLLVHPCDPRWERTTSPHPPRLSDEETTDLLEWVRAGGGLLLITEYEHDKYGDNFNDLLAAVGLRIENGKVIDRTACVPGNPEWIHAQSEPESPLSHGVANTCFFRAGWLTSHGSARIDIRASAGAHPANAGLLATAELGLGRIAVVTDSVLFGDEQIDSLDHAQLWLNVVHWLAVPTYRHPAPERPPSAVIEHPSWTRLKGIIGLLRSIQRPDGSIDIHSQSGAAHAVRDAVQELGKIAPYFPHQAEYLAQTARDLRAWETSGFAHPDFSASLALLRPERERIHQRELLVLFPLYTPNASSDIRFELLLTRIFWPDWLAHLERTGYPNPKFVPLEFANYTDGYASECAVLFPETVSVAGKATNHFGGIFCDREAARLQSTALRAASTTQLVLFPELECLLADRTLLQSVCALWDLIHDRAHALGELPFDPFMIRQRSPFWMYGLEELRVDVGAFVEAHRLAQEGFPFARYVTWAIILDRIFRFPITGIRVRNYDALGGQVLFAALHQHDAIVWRDNRLLLHWDQMPAVMLKLREELHALYKSGSDRSRVAFWMAAHEWTSRYVPANLGSQWRRDPWPDEHDPKAWLSRVHDDEFPLGNFHTNLQRKLRQAEEAGR